MRGCITSPLFSNVITRKALNEYKSRFGASDDTASLIMLWYDAIHITLHFHGIASPLNETVIIRIKC